MEVSKKQKKKLRIKFFPRLFAYMILQKHKINFCCCKQDRNKNSYLPLNDVIKYVIMSRLNVMIMKAEKTKIKILGMMLVNQEYKATVNLDKHTMQHLHIPDD